MKKRTGTGGCGGRRKAADMQIGSLGFRQAQLEALKKRVQKPANNWSQFNLAGSQASVAVSSNKARAPGPYSRLSTMPASMVRKTTLRGKPPQLKMQKTSLQENRYKVL